MSLISVSYTHLAAQRKKRNHHVVVAGVDGEIVGNQPANFSHLRNIAACFLDACDVWMLSLIHILMI